MNFGKFLLLMCYFIWYGEFDDWISSSFLISLINLWSNKFVICVCCYGCYCWLKKVYFGCLSNGC